MRWNELEALASTDWAKALFAGAAGGVVRWVTLRHDWREGIASIVVGALCALYLGPIVTPILAPVVGTIAPEGDSAGFSSFICGLGGISLSGFIIDVIRYRNPKGDVDEQA
jgi:hypothetical protein